MDLTDPSWNDDLATIEWASFMDHFIPSADKSNSNAVYAYIVAQAVAEVLKQCGDDLTRQNVMRQAANLKNFRSDMLLPGITVNTSPDDFFPIEQMQLMEFDGQSWRLMGETLSSE